MKVENVMTKSVASLNPDDTVDKAAQVMMENNIGSLPVCQQGKIIGILTDRDISIRSVGNKAAPNSKTVRDIMSSNPVTASPDMDVKDVSRIMSERQIRRVPVVENNNVVGIVSLGDLAVNPRSNNQAGDALSSISQPDNSQF
ncbi:CBS domain-containing protein [Clostridium kluyveri]|uniref:CBS domain-containing protein n=1 Tax=Clostridium kluyveri TaxID=1534 RepID=A0A1L5FD44_CLOKL|nr:CBS domain-containing protein [Clostridium kluyveri]APM40935.1 CBS domain-containing protein [Clostridium kluyveri]UZQ48788.1 CBS domain-containing protein [Clostridium kluyveri]